MDWTGAGVIVVSVLFAYAMFSEDPEENEPDHTEPTDHTEYEINDFKGRRVTLSCQSCRKLKSHVEIRPNLYQCVKCKRHVDLRVS